MKNLDYGKGYVYAHDTNEGMAAMSCLPEALADQLYYRPGQRGFEAELGQRMEQIRQWHLRRQQKAQDKSGGKE